jgi:phosphotransacetylase
VGKYDIIHTNSEREAAEKAVELIHEGKADLIMKGMVSTDKFMKVLLKKEYALVPSRSVFEPCCSDGKSKLS